MTICNWNCDFEFFLYPYFLQSVYRIIGWERLQYYVLLTDMFRKHFFFLKNLISDINWQVWQIINNRERENKYMYNIDNRQLIATYAIRTRKRENRQVNKKHYVLNLYQRVFQIRVDHTKKPSTISLQKNSIMLKLMCLIITFFFKMLQVCISSFLPHSRFFFSF